MARRFAQSDDSERTNPWITTYSDLVTLLMTFFILLFSMSIMNQARFQAIMSSVQGAFGILDGSPSTILDSEGSSLDPDLVAQELARLDKLADVFRSELSEDGLSEKVSLVIEERGLVFRFADSVLFDLGSADLRPEAGNVLTKVGSLLSTIPNSIRVEGHTDNWPISTDRFPSNWELSTGRATSVVRFLLSVSGLNGDKLQAGGYAEHHPIDTNETSLGRQRNRRVDIIVMRSSLSLAEPN